MAREIQDIKNSLTDRFIAIPSIQTLYGLTPGNSFANEFSLVSLENILFDIIAFGIWTLEAFWDAFVVEKDQEISEEKILQKPWYIKTALSYQHGFEIDDMGDYINGDATDEEIENSKIIAKVSFEKAIVQGHGVLRCKVVKEVGGELVPLSLEELTGFDYYINKKTGFGLRVISISRPHDNLILSMKIWYDPLVINATGAYLDGSDDTPMITAIDAYLKSLEFNGEFILTQFVDAMQKVRGVKIPKVLQASSNWDSISSSPSQSDYEGPIEEIRVTFSGYMRLDVGMSTFVFEPRVT